MTWVLDLDGVVWLDGHPIPGGAEAVARLRDRGDRVLFVTNNSSPTVGELLANLAVAGIGAEPDDVITSAHAAAGLLEAGARVHVLGGAGIRSVLRDRGMQIVDAGAAAEVVMVGFDRHADMTSLTGAARAVIGGARLIGTNDDATYPTPEGPLPGGGALLAAVAYASGVEPEVAGKPYPPMTKLLRERAGDIAVVVGDRPATDGRLAAALGARFALVLSGVTATANANVPEGVTAHVVGARLIDVVGA